MLTDNEIYIISRQIDEIKKDYEAEIKLKKPWTILGSVKIDTKSEDFWSRIKINNKNGSYIIDTKAIYESGCKLNPECEVGKCAGMQEIASYSKNGRNYLKGEKDTIVDWSDRKTEIPDIRNYLDEVINPIIN